MRQLKISRQITGRDSVAIDKYLQEIGKFEVLSPEEEAVLAQKIHEGDKEALQRLVEKRFTRGIRRLSSGWWSVICDLSCLSPSSTRIMG